MLATIRQNLHQTRPSSTTGTQPGNYAITVTGTFAIGSTNLSHATKLTLVVQ